MKKQGFVIFETRERGQRTYTRFYVLDITTDEGLSRFKALSLEAIEKNYDVRLGFI